MKKRKAREAREGQGGQGGLIRLLASLRNILRPLEWPYKSLKGLNNFTFVRPLETERQALSKALALIRHYTARRGIATLTCCSTCRPIDPSPMELKFERYGPL